MLDQLICPNCGATLPPQLAKADLITCQYCNTSFQIPHAPTPEPEMGDLILGADFRQQPVAGWDLPHKESSQLVNGTPPELRTKFPPKDTLHYVLTSSGYFDDLDASVTIKFYAGEVNQIDAGLILRYQKDSGSYCVLISPVGTYSVSYYEKGKTDIKDNTDGLTWNPIIRWTNHSAVRVGLNQENRLRFVANGEHLHIYINGTLITSIHDNHFDEGEIRLAAEGSKKSLVDVGFTNLQVREVRANGN